MFIKLSMFRNQNDRGTANHGTASFSAAVPFKNWKVGYIVVTENNPNDEWTILKIESADGKCRRDECVVSLRNVAQEERTIKGSTLQSSYKLKGYGDAAPPEEEERSDIKPIAVNVAGIREFYERKDGRPGSRVLMLDKTAYVVSEDFNTIWSKVVTAVGSATALLQHSTGAAVPAQNG